MGSSWEKRYFEDVLPEIEAYTREEISSFTSGDIAERLEKYTPQKVGRTLKHMTEKEGTDHVIRTGNNPKTWEAVLFEGTAWERLGYELKAEPQPREPEPTAKTPEEEDRLQNTSERKRLEISPEIKELSAQEYGKLMNNLEEVYEGLKEVKEERSSYFSTSDLDEKVEGVRAAEIGVVLSGLAAAGLVNKDSDRELYKPESIDEEGIKAFKEVVNATESFEDFKEMVTEERE